MPDREVVGIDSQPWFGWNIYHNLNKSCTQDHQVIKDLKRDHRFYGTDIDVPGNMSTSCQCRVIICHRVTSKFVRTLYLRTFLCTASEYSVLQNKLQCSFRECMYRFRKFLCQLYLDYTWFGYDVTYLLICEDAKFSKNATAVYFATHCKTKKGPYICHELFTKVSFAYNS